MLRATTRACTCTCCKASWCLLNLLQPSANPEGSLLQLLTVDEYLHLLVFAAHGCVLAKAHCRGHTVGASGEEQHRSTQQSSTTGVPSAPHTHMRGCLPQAAHASCCGALPPTAAAPAVHTSPPTTTKAGRTVEGRALECAVWLLHHHDVDGTSHVGCEAIDSTQDGCPPHHHPALQARTTSVDQVGRASQRCCSHPGPGCLQCRCEGTPRSTER